MNTKEEIKFLVQRQLAELEIAAMEIVKAIEIKQEEHRHIVKQIKGLRLFLDSEHDRRTSDDFEETNYITPKAKVIKDTIADILTSVYPGKLHYIDIYEILKSKGYSIPGKDPRQNLLSYLSRDGRFIRCEERGSYKIKEDDLIVSIRGLSRSMG
jgi:hypothetical protein